MENWRGGDCDETQNGAHAMRRKGCAMQNQRITLSILTEFEIKFLQNAQGFHRGVI